MKFIKMKQEISLFDKIIDTFQILYPNNPCYIAGGAVRDILLSRAPKDIDIYFLGLGWDKDSKIDFEKKLSASDIYYKIATSNLPWHKYERYLLLSIIWDACKELKGTDLQFMGFPVNSLENLLKTFDWEICVCGYKNGEITTIKSAIELIHRVKTYKPTDKDYKPPRMKLCNVQFPISNLRRGFKFESRYHLKMDYKCVLKLCQAVLDENRE